MRITNLVAALTLCFTLGACCSCFDTDCDDCEEDAPSEACSPSCGEPCGAAAGEMTSELPHRKFHFRYEARVPVAAGTKVLDIWVPLPMDDPGVQLVANLDTHGGNLITEPVHGNRMLHKRMENPKEGTVIVSWSADITRIEDHGQGTLPNRPVYLQPNALIPLDGVAKERATMLGADQGEVPVALRARKIYDDVLESMAYDKSVPGFGKGDFMRAMDVCKGNCTDFHARFIGTGRAAGIPARFTMGIPMKLGAGDYNSYHCWAHWNDGKSWRPVDISEADKDPSKAEFFFGALDPNRVALSFGRDIDLCPKQAGPALNYFVFPYAEADGKPVAMNKKEHWRFSWK